MTFIFLSDMTENEKRKEGNYLITCFVIHVLLSYTIFLEKAVLQKSLSLTTHLQILASLVRDLSFCMPVQRRDSSKELSWFGRLNQVLETTTMR